MKWIDVNGSWDSDLKIKFSTDSDFTILKAECVGVYKRGSEGNEDGLYLFSKLVSHYFIYEPICIILDLVELEYSFGNTLLKSLNFFNEIGRDEHEKDKLCVIIPSQSNEKPLVELVGLLRQPHNIQICKDKNEALLAAMNYVKEYLD